MLAHLITILCIIPYLIFAGLWLAGRRISSQKKRKKSIAGPVSVIIPFRNEMNRLDENTGKQFGRWKLPPGSEILAVDDHSDDGTLAYLQTTAEKIPQLRVLVLPEGKTGKKAAIEYGVSVAAHPLIITLDADTEPQPESISAMAEALADKRTKLVCGTVIQRSAGWAGAPLADLEFLSLSTSGAAFAGLGFPFLSNGAFLGFTREAFLHVNGYMGNEQFPGGDDVFLTEKIRKTYGRRAIHYLTNRNETAITSGDMNAEEFFSRRIRWGSKSAGYGRAGKVITLAVLGINLLWSAAFLFHLFWGDLHHILLISGLKILCDAAMLGSVCIRYRQYRLVLFILPASFLHPFYLLVTALVSIPGRFRWKGRTYQTGGKLG